VPLIILIPETVSSGQHQVLTSLALPSGIIRQGSFTFTVPEPSLIIQYSGPTPLNAGDTANLTIENIGGVDTTYITEELRIRDSRDVEIYNGDVTGTILSGEKKTLTDVKIPSQTLNGPASLKKQVKETRTGKMFYF
jgi:hypothetical protein